MFGDFPIEGKIIAVTGGASGIGLAFCKLALSSNAKVIVADLNLSDDLERLAKENSNICFIKVDVTRWDEIEAIVSFSQTKFGSVPDIYIANAGVGESERSGFWSNKEKERYATLDVNLSHPIKFSRIAIQALVSQGKKGVILITSSIAGIYGHLSTPLYSASKHGTIGLIKSLARAETETNVKVVGICPGLVHTPLLMGIAESGGAKLSEDPKFILPKEIASRMKDLIEQSQYPGGTAMGVYRPGEATIVADGSYSGLEELAPSDVASVRRSLGL